MKCSNCGKENSNNAKFCTKCGKTFGSENKAKNTKLIIIGLVAVIIVLAGVAIYASGILTPIEFETKNFDGFTMDVPVDSNYVLSDEHTTDPKNIFVGYQNNNPKTLFETSGFFVGNNVTKRLATFDCELIEQDGDLIIYKNDSGELPLYKIFKEGNDANLLVMGSNLDALKHMANSFKDKDFLKLGTSTSTSSSKSSSSTTTKHVESKSWQSIGSYSGSGSGSESITVPEGKIMVKLSAHPIKNYATNHLYVTSSTGDSGGVDWGPTSAVETRSDSFTFTSHGYETLDIDYNETVSWNVEIYKYQ